MRSFEPVASGQLRLRICCYEGGNRDWKGTKLQAKQTSAARCDLETCDRLDDLPVLVFCQTHIER